jgi:hypothetical protein
MSEADVLKDWNNNGVVEHVAKALANAVAMNYDHNEAIFTLYARAAIAAVDEFRGQNNG